MVEKTFEVYIFAQKFDLLICEWNLILKAHPTYFRIYVGYSKIWCSCKLLDPEDYDIVFGVVLSYVSFLVPKILFYWDRYVCLEEIKKKSNYWASEILDDWCVCIYTHTHLYVLLFCIDIENV